jgi:NAD(P)-dependent dehydrogenase (short-subunit alcohol dehydrogenase family)
VKKALGKNDRLSVLALDVIDEAQTASAVDAALKEFGQIDVLVNNAGRGLVGAIEETSTDEVRSIFAVNVEGILNVSRAVLPSMRARRSGRILNLSSVGGFVSWPGWGIYCSTKFAVEGISAELKPLGISVTLIEPGPFRTDFLDASSLVRTKSIIEDYSASSGAARQWADSSHDAQPGDPIKAAAAILKIAHLPDPPLRLQLGADCVAAVEAKLEQIATELNKWRSLAESTAFEDVRS